MQFLNFTNNTLFSKVVPSKKNSTLFSFPPLLLIDFDFSILLIIVVLVGIITFLAGIAYGIYLNDKITEKETANQLSRS